VALNPNARDAHTLVEMLDPATATWLLVIPTFGLTVRRTADGGFATSRRRSSAAIRAQRWTDMTNEFS
jgi:hypothetical protein